MNYFIAGLMVISSGNVFAASVSKDEVDALLRGEIHQAYSMLKVGTASTYRVAVKGLDKNYPDCWVEIGRKSVITNVAQQDWGGYRYSGTHTLLKSKLAQNTGIDEVDFDNASKVCQSANITSADDRSFDSNDELAAIDYMGEYKRIMEEDGYDVISQNGVEISSNKLGQTVLIIKSEKGQVSFLPSHLSPFSYSIPGKVYTLEVK